MGKGTLVVEVGFSAKPLDAIAGIVWTDISAYVLSWNLRRGKANQRDGRAEAGTATVRLNNNDRRFDPENTGSPYSPNVKPMRRIRIRVTHLATTYDLFHGYIEAWTPSYPARGGKNAVTTLTCVDAFAVLALLDLDAPYVMEVLKDSPKGYWRLNESTGATVAADSSGNGFDGLYNGSLTFGQTDPITDDIDGAIALNVDGDTVTVHHEDKLAIAGVAAFAVELWFRAPLTFTNSAIAHQRRNPPVPPDDFWRVDIINGDVHFFTVASGEPISSVNTSVGDLRDNAWHQCLCARESGGTLRIYIDGVEAVSGVPTQRSLSKLPLQLLTNQLVTLDEWAFYHTVPSPSRVSAHYSARTAWLNQLSGTRVTSLLDIINWPAADRDVDAGQSTLQSAGDIGGSEALTHLLDVADWEHGLFFITKDGKARFDDRHARWKTPLSTVQATFAWSATGTDEAFHMVEPSFDVEGVRNHVLINRTGGASHVAADATSKTDYGKRVLEKTIKTTSDSEAKDLAFLNLTRRKDPLLRIEEISITPGDTDDLWTQVLAREVSDKIKVILRPPGGGTETSKNFFIETIDLSAARDMATLACKWLLSPAERDEEFFIIGSSKVGTGRVGA